MPIATLLITTLLADLVLMLLILVVALRRRDMGWVDFGWALGVGLTKSCSVSACSIQARPGDAAPARRWRSCGPRASPNIC